MKLSRQGDGKYRSFTKLLILKGNLTLKFINCFFGKCIALNPNPWIYRLRGKTFQKFSSLVFGFNSDAIVFNLYQIFIVMRSYPYLLTGLCFEKS